MTTKIEQLLSGDLSVEDFLNTAVEPLPGSPVEWDPFEVLLPTQRCICNGCGEIGVTTMGLPLIVYRSHRGKQRTQQTPIPPRELPLRVVETQIRVPVCHVCVPFNDTPTAVWQLAIPFAERG